MNILRVSIPIGLGDLIYTKAMLDSVKHLYNQIHIRIFRDIISSYGIDPKYNNFLDEIGNLFFSEPPYILTSENIPFYGLVDVCTSNSIMPVKPNLKNLLCEGTTIDVGEEYIVLVTKVRYMAREHFEEKRGQLFDTLRQLSQKYKIVILGEREVQFNGGYTSFVGGIYSIYNDIIQHIPSDRLLDLSMSALGITAPNLINIRQDCLTMSRAKFVVTMGVGGGFCMATAVANTIGYRIDQDPIADAVFDREYSDALITKDWSYFINKLQSYL